MKISNGSGWGLRGSVDESVSGGEDNMFNETLNIYAQVTTSW